MEVEIALEIAISVVLVAVAITFALLSSLAALAETVAAKRPAYFALAAPATATAARFF
jgi:hypothetical protein